MKRALQPALNCLALAAGLASASLAAEDGQGATPFAADVTARLGGDTTVTATGADAFTHLAANAPTERSRDFALGNTRANRRVRPPSEAEVARAVAEFHARGGQVTVCPAAYAVPVGNGAGREVRNWVA